MLRSPVRKIWCIETSLPVVQAKDLMTEPNRHRVTKLLTVFYINVLKLSTRVLKFLTFCSEILDFVLSNSEHVLYFS